MGALAFPLSVVQTLTLAGNYKFLLQRVTLAEQNPIEMRTVLAHTLFANPNSEGALGTVKPVAEIVDDVLVPLTPESFCPTMKVFIVSGYEDLEKRFPIPNLFMLQVSPNTNPSENADANNFSRYISNFKRADAVKPKDYFEVIKSSLPDPNVRDVYVSQWPGTRYIFIDDGNDIYGPFKWEPHRESLDLIRLGFIDSKLPYYNNEVAFQVCRIERNKFLAKTVISKDAHQERRFLYDLSVVLNESYHDYSSDEDVLKFAAKLAQENNVRVIEKAKFDSLATLLGKNGKLGTPLIRQRLARLPQIVSATSVKHDEILKGLWDFLKGEHGKGIVSTYIEQNREQYLQSLRKQYEQDLRGQLEGLTNEIRLAEARKRELDTEKQSLAALVESKRREAEAAPNLAAEHNRLDVQLAKKHQELAEIEKSLAEQLAKQDALTNLDEINRQIKEAEREREYAIRSKLTAEDELGELQRAVNDKDSELRKKLTSLKPYVDAINGTFISDSTENPAMVSVSVHDLKSGKDLVGRQREVITAVRRALAGRQRYMEDWQVANILISTQQSFITFFAGLPGVGKTSLARLLAEVQGVSPRLSEVSVARGWTSQKDLIGFYNPLSGRFQSSGTGMYELLKTLDGEKKGAHNAMSYVLLDEANLSPIEHYWSCFMGMADGEGNRQLVLGRDRIQIPPYLRFLATINYDGTTEPLSPRMADRASIILMEPALDDSRNVDDSRDAPCALPLSAQTMHQLFGCEDVVPDLLPEELSAFKRVRQILAEPDPQQGMPLSISKRKEIAISQYCSKARGIMRAENDALLALDVAILQHVLPQIRGNGRFGKRLEVLARELESSGLARSSAFVRRMIDVGDIDLQTYDFFCW
ncbi:hypothetical protein [Cupriavidus sp. D39]|uniref:hypothetical protein n=1 Tax=Cupriavidus sp. D39 TaxID=2997877 RepID=UPI00226EF39B|nr:hypothetical protein [Cupriavidus sp. D39]MCY0856639.1 hypothetical protein [Cupriavidus sp. D39]